MAIFLAQCAHFATAAELADYPLASEVWLGGFGAVIEVDPSTDLTTLRGGDIHWLVEDGIEVAESEVVAHSSAGQIRQSTDQLALDEAGHLLKLREARWTHQEKLLSLRRQREEIQGSIAKLTPAAAEAALFEAPLLARLAEERGVLAEQLQSIDDKLSPEFSEEELRLVLDQLAQDLSRSRFDHQELVRSLEIVAPHPGILRHLASGSARANEIVGTIVRKGVATASIQLVDPVVRSEAPELLALRLSGSDGKIYRGSFDFLERGAGGRLGTAIYHFTMAAAPDQQEIPGEIAGERMITLYRMLADEARILPKSEFLFQETEQIQTLGWTGLIEQRWPGSRVLFVGPRSIAVAAQP